MEIVDFNLIIKTCSELKNDNIIPRLSMDDCRLLYGCTVMADCRTIVEIGAMMGTSSIVLGLAAKITGGHVWSIEVRPRKEWPDNIKAFGLENVVELVKGDSKQIDLKLDQPIDFLFIDGDHQTASVLADYWHWSPLVRSGGLIAFHDIYGPPAIKVNSAIAMIVANEKHKLKEIWRCPPARDCGTVVFEKTG